MSEKETDEKIDTRPRRPRRQRQDDTDQQVEKSEEKPSRQSEPQAKPRRRRREVDDEDTQGDGGWMGGAPDSKAKNFAPDPEPEKDVHAMYDIQYGLV